MVALGLMMLYQAVGIWIIYNWFFAEPADDGVEVEPFISVQSKSKERKYNPDDYWEEEVDYATGEIVTNTGPAIRHPKNRDRAYEGSVERFHHGGW